MKASINSVIEKKNNAQKVYEPISSSRYKNIIGLMVATVVLLILIFLSLMVGAKQLSFETVWSVLFTSADGYDASIIKEVRLPRTMIALFVGPAFGLAGAIIQSLTRNPLADPGVLGVNAGSAFGVALAIGIFSINNSSSYIWFSMVGALVATVAIYFISAGAGKRTPTPEQITLAGVAMGAAFSGVVTALSMIDSKAFAGMLNWRVGTIARKGLEDLWPVVPFIIVGIVLALIISFSLNVIAFGDDRASSLGVNVNLIRVLGLIAITLLAGGGTAIAGPIGFIGLMVPHAVRWFTGHDQPWIFAYSIVVSPIILLSADIIGRIIMPTGEVPVGIVMGFIGAPVLLALVRKRRTNQL